MYRAEDNVGFAGVNVPERGVNPHVLRMGSSKWGVVPGALVQRRDAAVSSAATPTNGVVGNETPF